MAYEFFSDPLPPVNVAIAVEFFSKNFGVPDKPNYTGDVSQNTEAQWNAVVWNETIISKPTWSEVTGIWPIAYSEYIRHESWRHYPVVQETALVTVPEIENSLPDAEDLEALDGLQGKLDAKQDAAQILTELSELPPMNDAMVHINSVGALEETPVYNYGVNFMASVNDSESVLKLQPALNSVIDSRITGKVDKITGKGLSTEDYTTAEKTKLAGIATGATANDNDANLKNRANHTGTQGAATIIDFATAADARITAQKGANNGIASLDSGGKVPSAQLPSYVDDVLEFANLGSFPGSGETGKIYIAIDTNRQYRWSGSAYVQIVASPGTTDNVQEGTTNLYHTTARTRAAVRVYSDTTLLSGAFQVSKSGTINSGSIAFHYTDNGLSTGNAIFPNGPDKKSVMYAVNDSAASHQAAWAWSNGDKTLTFTVNRYSTANLLSGVLGQVASNGQVLNATVTGN